MLRPELANLIYFKPNIDLSYNSILVLCHSPTLSSYRKHGGTPAVQGDNLPQTHQLPATPLSPRKENSTRREKNPNLSPHLLFFPICARKHKFARSVSPLKRRGTCSVFPNSHEHPQDPPHTHHQTVAFKANLTDTRERTLGLWPKKLLNNFTVSLLSLGKKVIAL